MDKFDFSGANVSFRRTPFRMLARKPPMLVIVALANKIARVAWALIAKVESYRAPVVAA